MGVLSNLWGRIWGRASIENPRIDLNNPDDWEAFGMTRSTSGVSVTRDSALTYNPVWRGVNLLAGDVAKLPLFIYRRTGQGKERAAEHPGYQLLRYKPSTEVIAFHFKKTLMVHALLSKGGFAYIVRDGAARPLDLILLNPDVTCPIREGGRLLYDTEIKLGENRFEKKKLLPENVLHIKGLSLDGVQAVELVRKARNSFGLGMAAEDYSGRFYRNNATPNIAIQYPGKMNPEAARKFLAKWNAKHEGLDNSHRAALLQEGMTLVQYAIKARDAQLNETRLFEIIAVANWLGMPPHKLGHPGYTSYASQEQANQQYLDECLDQWLVLFEEECRDKLLTEDEKANDTHVVEFLREALVRADLATRAAYYRTATGGRPWMVPDEVRGRENMNLLGGDAAEYKDPLNMGQGGADNQEKPKGAPPKKKTPPPDTGDDTADEGDQAETDAELLDAERALLVDATARMIRRLGTHARRAAGRPEQFLGWLNSFADEHRQIVAAAYAPALALLRAHGHPVDTPDAAAAELLAHVRQSLLEVSGRVQAPALHQAIEKELGLLEAWGAEGFARRLLVNDKGDPDGKTLPRAA